MNIFSDKPSMRKKLILMFVGTTIVCQLALGAIAQYTIESHFYDLASSYIEKHFTALNQNTPPDRINRKKIRGFERSSLKVWYILDNKVDFQNSSTLLPSDPKNFFLKNRDDQYSKQWSSDGDHYLAISFYINKDTTVAVGIDINHHIEFFKAVRTMMFWLTVFMSILAGLYSIIIVNNGLRPLKRFEEYLKKVHPGHLDIRIPTKKLPIELEALSKTQNEMLDRLDTGFKRLSEFSSDIAHELRTPLTNLSTQTQVVLSNERKIDEYQDVLASNLEELERINKTINDTLYLAKAENSLLYKNNERLDINGIIGQLVDYQSIAAEDKELTIEMQGHAEFVCDKHLLQRAINNILCNAVRHSSAYSTIKILIEQQENMDLTISICNVGDTIPPESLPFIFDRFYRKRKSREHEYGFGAGLGLAITKSIIEIYDGTITAASADGQTKFEIFFPASDSAV